MSASYLVDLGNTVQIANTLPPTTGTIGSGGFVDALRSGIMIGKAVDMLQSDSMCNVIVIGTNVASGPLVLQVQTTDQTSGSLGAGAALSGTFTDPTSGLPVMPTTFTSGGLLTIGASGDPAPAGFQSGFNSGQMFAQPQLSGFAIAAAFQRVGRYVRVNMLSGFYAGPLQVMVASQYKTTGSGGGFSLQPSSGGISV